MHYPIWKMKGGGVNPHVSIIVPMYNVEAYVGECFDALLRQTEGDFEVLAVDDGSTDDTFAVAQSVAGGDERFVFFRQENKGQSAARNFAIEQARGDYMLFLDADDYYRDDTLQVLAEYAAENELDYLDFTAKTFYENESLRKSRGDEYDNRPDIPGVLTGPQLFVEYQKRKAYYCSPCMHYFKRSLLMGSGPRFDVGHIHEDELFSPQLIARAKRAAYLNEPLYNRRVRQNSSMTEKFGIHNVHGAFMSTQKLYAWLCAEGSKMDGAFVDALAQRIFEVRELLCGYIDATDEQQLDEYARSLDAQDRADFAMDRCLAEYLHDLYNSHTFKVGHAIMAGPSWLKRKLG